MKKIGLWRAVAFAAVVALVLPGGIALSNYSGPNPQKAIIHPPYHDASRATFESCPPLAACDSDAWADASLGTMHTSAQITSPAGGLAPALSGSVEASSTLDIVDNFRAGTTDNALYRFDVHINSIRQKSSGVLGAYGYGYSALEISVSPEGCRACGRGNYVDLYPGGPSDRQVDVVIPGAFHGKVDIVVILRSVAYVSQLFIGETKTSADIRIPRVTRIW